MKAPQILLLLFAGALAALAQSNPSCPGATGATPHCIAFAWTAPTTGSTPTSYNLYTGGTVSGACSSVTATTCSKVASVAAPALAFTLNSSATLMLTEGATYYYVVTASNAAGESAPSVEVSAKIPVLLPSSPTNFTAAPK